MSDQFSSIFYEKSLADVKDSVKNSTTAKALGISSESKKKFKTLSKEAKKAIKEGDYKTARKDIKEMKAVVDDLEKQVDQFSDKTTTVENLCAFSIWLSANVGKFILEVETIGVLTIGVIIKDVATVTKKKYYEVTGKMKRDKNIYLRDIKTKIVKYKNAIKVLESKLNLVKDTKDSMKELDKKTDDIMDDYNSDDFNFDDI